MWTSITAFSENFEQFFFFFFFESEQLDRIRKIPQISIDRRRRGNTGKAGSTIERICSLQSQFSFASLCCNDAYTGSLRETSSGTLTPVNVSTGIWLQEKNKSEFGKNLDFGFCRYALIYLLPLLLLAQCLPQCISVPKKKKGKGIFCP